MQHQLLISPSEPAELRHALDAIISDEPEQYGADVLVYLFMYSQPVTIGWQRKTYPDLLESLRDGRVYDFVKMRKLDYPNLILEGQPKFTNELLVRSDGRKTKFTRASLRNIERSAKWVHGIAVEHTRDIADTADIIIGDVEYFEEEKHISLFRRPRLKGEWGYASLDELKLHFMQGLPGVGPVTAKKILDEYKNPIRWNLTSAELEKIDGVGKKTADALIRFLE